MPIFGILAAVVWFMLAMGWPLWDLNLVYLALCLMTLQWALGGLALPRLRRRGANQT